MEVLDKIPQRLVYRRKRRAFDAQRPAERGNQFSNGGGHAGLSKPCRGDSAVRLFRQLGQPFRRFVVWRLAEGLDSAREVAIAKYWAGDTGHRVSFAAQHLHGGIGVDKDYPLYRYCLWSKQRELSLGSSAHQLAARGASLAEVRA